MSILVRGTRWVLLTVAVVISLFPLYWMIRTSLAPVEQANKSGIPFIPTEFDLSSYARAWEDAGMGRAVVTGLIVTLAILALQLATCIPAAYVLAKVRTRASSVVFLIVLVCLLMPSQATMIPTFIGINAAGLADSYAGLVLPFTTSAFGIFLLRQQMLSIPDSLLEAARTDGLGHFQILRKIVVPLAGPGIAAFSIFSVFAHWNDYLWPLLVVRSPDLVTPPLALAAFQHADIGFDYAALAAGAVIVTAPVVLLFLAAQRRFVQGMSGAEIPG